MTSVNTHIADVTRQTEEQHRNKAPLRYRVVSKVTELCGTVGFLIANLLFFSTWVALNEFVVEFDPYPYTFLLFGVSLEAIFLSILILISQNMDAEESERRHHLDLQMNLLTEREITAVMRLIVKMAERSGISAEDTKEVREFAHETDPTAVLMQIVKGESEHRR